MESGRFPRDPRWDLADARGLPLVTSRDPTRDHVEDREMPRAPMRAPVGGLPKAQCCQRLGEGRLHSSSPTLGKGISQEGGHHLGFEHATVLRHSRFRHKPLPSTGMVLLL